MTGKLTKVDDPILRLMAQIMHEGMTGYKIAEVFNDANKKHHFAKKDFDPPAKTQKRKEQYAYDILRAMQENEWDAAIIYAAELLCDSSRAYFTQDETHPYPEDKVSRLRKKLCVGSYNDTDDLERRHGLSIRAALRVIDNGDLREILYQDIKDIQNCIENSAWKPALVLCGSVLEAVLTDWLESEDISRVRASFKRLYPNKKAKKLSEFSLEELIDISEDLQLIHGYHAAISDGIRNFRNLIHPSIAIRKDITVNKSIANIGIEIIWAILQERKKIESD